MKRTAIFTYFVYAFAATAFGIVTVVDAAADALAAPAGAEKRVEPKAEPEPIADLSGIYAVVGSDGDAQYAGSVLVVKAGEGYVFLWSTVITTEQGLATGTQQGTGLRKGAHLSVAWGTGKSNGVTVYAIKGKSLVGEWTQSATLGRRNRETLTKIGPLPDPDPGGFQ